MNNSVYNSYEWFQVRAIASLRIIYRSGCNHMNYLHHNWDQCLEMPNIHRSLPWHLVRQTVHVSRICYDCINNYALNELTEERNLVSLTLLDDKRLLPGVFSCQSCCFCCLVVSGLDHQPVLVGDIVEEVYQHEDRHITKYLSAEEIEKQILILDRQQGIHFYHRCLFSW